VSLTRAAVFTTLEGGGACTHFWLRRPSCCSTSFGRGRPAWTLRCGTFGSGAYNLSSSPYGLSFALMEAAATPEIVLRIR